MTTGLLGVGVSFAEELSGVVTVRGVTTATVGMGSCRAQGLTLPSGERTWTVLGAGVGVVVSVPGAVRAGLGCGDVGELRGVPVLVADRGRTGGRVDRASSGPVCRG